jgi:hypothetical protein
VAVALLDSPGCERLFGRAADDCWDEEQKARRVDYLA